MASNVIQFPEEQSLRKRIMERARDQKAVLGLSIASVLMVTVFLNEWLVVRNNVVAENQASRSVASLDQAAIANDIKWEHGIAGNLAKEEIKNSSSLAEKPTVRDELIFGYLQGKYGMRLSNGKVESLEFLNSNAGDQPIFIENRQLFLKNFKAAFAHNFTQVAHVSTKDGVEIYTLVDDSNTIVGRVELSLDSESRMTQLRITE